MSHYLSSPNRRDELALVEAASRNPLLGITLVLEALPTIAKREPQRIWGLIFAEQTADGGNSAGWNIKYNLPAPREATGGDDLGVKYLIVSDLHRDAASDDVGILETGSIDHFTANATLYGRILDFVKDEGHILIEGGDCEELWFVRDADDYEKKRMDGSTSPTSCRRSSPPIRTATPPIWGSTTSCANCTSRGATTGSMAITTPS